MKKVTIYYCWNNRVKQNRDYVCEETYEAFFAWKREYVDAEPEYPATMLELEWEYIPTHFTIIQEGQYIGKVAIQEQAVNAAKICAADTGKPVFVVEYLEDGRGREIIFNPDGTSEMVGILDKFQCMELSHTYPSLNRV